MRNLLSITVVATFALSGCGMTEQPQSDTEIAAEIVKIDLPKPGRWSSHFDLMAFSVDGAPQEVADRFQRELAARGRLGQVVCVTQAMVRDYTKGRFQTYDGAACKVSQFRVEQGKYSATMTCNYANQMTGTVEMEGQSGPETSSDSAQVEMAMTSDPSKKVRYSMLLRSERVGDCPAS